MKMYSIDKTALTSIAAIAAKTFQLDCIKLLKLVDLITEDGDKFEFSLPENKKFTKEIIDQAVDELLNKLEALTPEERKNAFSVISEMMVDEDAEKIDTSITKTDVSDTKVKDNAEVKKDEPNDKQYVFTAYCYAVPVAVRSTATKILDCYVKGHGEVRPSDLNEEEVKKIISYRSNVFSYDQHTAKKIFASLVDRIRGTLICDRWRAAAV